MKPDVLMVWSSRPRQTAILEETYALDRTVVDEPALIEALRSGGIAAAGLDVFASKPDPNPLVAMDNVVVHPHHASGTVETRDVIAQRLVDNLAAFFAGKPILTSVNPPRT